MILTLGFLCMAYDESFQVHEKLMRPVKTLLSHWDRFGIFYYAWVIPGIVGVLLIFLLFLRYLFRLPKKTRTTFFIAAGLYFGGCIGFELIGGAYDERYGSNNLTYNLITTIEESVEMTGVIVFIYALLVYIADHYNEVRFQLNGEG